MEVELRPVLPPGFKVNARDTWLMVNRSRSYTAELHQQYGEAVTLFNPSKRPLIIFFTPEGARQVLTADPAGYDPFWKEGFSGIAGRGSLWVLGGEAHRSERALLSPAFHPSNFREYGETIQSVTHQKLLAWKPGVTIRALDTTRSISLDIIMRLVFGLEDGRLMEQGRKILFSLWHSMRPLIVFFPNLQRGWFPLWAKYARIKMEFNRWVHEILQEHRSRQEETSDILSRMLAVRRDDGSAMREEDIRDELLTILLSGHETTATAMAWALYELGRNPALLQKLRAELECIDAEQDLEAVPKLPYLAAVCNETLRLHTLLPEVARVAVSPLILSRYTIPAGGFVIVSAMTIHHDSGLYPQPDLFLPERFLERTFSPFEFLPFGGGHRRCLGSGLSDYEMRIALAEIITHWEYEPVGLEREIRHDIAMGPKNGVRLRINGRRRDHKSGT